MWTYSAYIRIQYRNPASEWNLLWTWPITSTHYTYTYESTIVNIHRVSLPNFSNCRKTCGRNIVQTRHANYTNRNDDLHVKSERTKLHTHTHKPIHKTTTNNNDIKIRIWNECVHTIARTTEYAISNVQHFLTHNKLEQLSCTEIRTLQKCHPEQQSPPNQSSLYDRPK